MASQETRREAIHQRPVFKPYEAVGDAMQEDPGLSSHQLCQKVKAEVEKVKAEVEN